jgi:Na+/proline symporter
VQRLLSIKNFGGMVKAQILDHLLEIILLALLFFIGLGLFAYFSLFPERLAEGISGDRILPFYIIHALPAGVSGLIIAAVFAAAMSTVDSGVHSMSTLILVDFIQPLRKSALDSRRSLQVARGLTVVLGLLATASGLLVSQIEGILKAISMIGGYVASPVTALFLMGILTRRGNFGGWLIATCLVTIPTQVYIQNYSDTHWIFYGALGMVICLAASYPFSLIVARVRRLPPADREYTLWRRRAPGERYGMLEP